jgi:hypothetical protein
MWEMFLGIIWRHFKSLLLYILEFRMNQAK